ncbi:MAG: Do family serine endopeptidase [candidate division Zixibacteria bacterium]|nr:Do family serine endopeptidase [candidate division Zixibacteria bacterium]
MGFKLKTKAALLAVAVSCFLAGAIVTGTLDLTPWGRAAPQTSGDLEALRRIGQGFSGVVKQVSPSVVNVQVSQAVKMPHPPFGESPFDFFGEGPLGRFFEWPEGEDYLRQGAGSGVIVSKDGYILTNNHVIEGADEITVTTNKGEEHEADVVGTDPRTDLAVIKVKGKDLPAAKLGDSERIEVGEWVLAVGNPFQLENTVTAGIISARGRSNVGLADYEDFIQTDAAINPGNSGGPLVNLDGEVIGINTAIATRTGGFMGVGFAIPINMAKQIMEQLIKTGKVTRGWLGIYIQPITPELMNQFKLKSTEGALVADVNEDGPAEKAGMRRGDVIVAYRGEKIKDPNNLRNLVAATDVGTLADVKLVRDGKERTLRVKIGELPEEVAAIGRPSGRDLEKDLGFNVGNLTPSLRRKLGLPEDQEGVVVGSIRQASDAYQNGLRKGDVIVEVNREAVSDVGDFNRAVSDISVGDQVLLVVITEGHTRYVTFELGK